jgi:GTPase SAR1 family protein
MSVPTKEYNLCVLGKTEVGKTSLCNRLTGKPFSRKNKCPQSLEDEPTKYAFEISTSDGIVLLNLFDWAWEEIKRDQNINQALMRGHDGAIFMYSVDDRRSKGDFQDYSDWYQRAAGYDKPWLIVSNKNDLHKKTVSEDEGHALARGGSNRHYAAISLVDDAGVEDFVLSLAKMMLGDVNVSLTSSDSFGAASPASIAWSAEQAATKTAGLGLGFEALHETKTCRVLLVVMNSAVATKFSEVLDLSQYQVEQVMSADECASEIVSPEDPASLPVGAIIAPPTASTSQQHALQALATQHNIVFVVSVPRNAPELITEAMSKMPKAASA